MHVYVWKIWLFFSVLIDIKYAGFFVAHWAYRISDTSINAKDNDSISVSPIKLEPLASDLLGS